MSAILFCAFYILLFSAIIMRSKWFKAGGFVNKHFLAVFYLKLLFGVVLWYIYTHIYKNRITSDIFKYYDDARIMFATLHTSAKDYLAMLTGIGDSGTYCQNIYHSMNSWFNGYGTDLYSNSHFIIRMNALFLLFSRGHYGVHVIFMCFISFTGFTFVYKAFLPFLQEKSKALFAAVFLFPSVILWSSGNLKEGFVWLGLGLSVYYFLKFINTPTPKGLYLISYILYVLIGFVIIYQSKAYVFLCILPCFISLFLIRKIKFCKSYALLTYLAVVLLYFSCTFLPHFLLGKESPLKLISDKQTDFNNVSRGGIYLEMINDPAEYVHIPFNDSINIIPLNSRADSLLHTRGIQYLTQNPFFYNEFKSKHKVPFMLKKGTSIARSLIGGKDTIHTTANDSTAYYIYTYIEPAKSSIVIKPIKPRITSLIKNIPQALEISLLLPYPWKVYSAMTALYCAENIFVLMLIIFALFFIKRPIPHREMVLFCLTYCLTMLVLIGLVTPILGGIERYKSLVIPFMFILLLLITQKPIAKVTADS